jgi:hypothetical protein
MYETAELEVHPKARLLSRSQDTETYPMQWIRQQQGIVSEVHMAGLTGPLEYERAVNLLTQRYSLHW